MAETTNRRVVIIGAGIAGLAAARGCVDKAREAGMQVEVTLIERAHVVGGKAQTQRRDGWTLETGPTGYLDSEPVMDKLVSATGLKKLVANEAATRRFLVRNEELKEIVANPLRFLTSGILSPSALVHLALEPFRKRLITPGGGSIDESVWQFAARRLGPQAADRLVAPMVLGVFAGDAKRTSLLAAFPRMAELEAKYGSLIKALVAIKAKGRTTSGGPIGPSGKLTSFAGGLNQLPRTLAECGERDGDFNVQCNTIATKLAHEGKRWLVDITQTQAGTFTRSSGSAAASKRETLHADAVILTTESFAAAELLRPTWPTVAIELDAISTPPVAVVGLGFGPEVLSCVPRGFGALVQRGGRLRILGVLWDTHLFPGRSPDGTLLMRCMFGGATDPESGALSDEELIEIAQADLARLFRLKGSASEPIFHGVARWPRAIPQYEIGHIARIKRIRSELFGHAKSRPGLFLAGNYLDGVAFNKSAKCGYEAGLAAVQGFACPQAT